MQAQITPNAPDQIKVFVNQYFNDKNFRNNLNLKNYFEANMATLSSQYQDVVECLQAIPEPKKYLSLFIWLLRTLMIGSQTKNDQHFNIVQAFASMLFTQELLLDKQLQTNQDQSSSAREFIRFATPYADYLIAEGKPKHGMAYMITTINLVYSDCLSSYHTEVAKLALKAHCYPHIKKIIENTHVRLAPHMAPIDVYTYFYYSGLVCLNQQKWTEARDRFNRVLALPTTLLHMVHVESYKKLILLSMIFGKEYTLPKNVSKLLQKSLQLDKHAAQIQDMEFGGSMEDALGPRAQMEELDFKDYLRIQNSWTTQNAQQFEQTMSDEKIAAKLHQDTNFGLAMHVLQRITSQKVKKLGNVYLTLNFKDIASKIENLKEDQVENYMKQTIAKGQLEARINQENKTVEFIDQVDDALELVEKLEEQNCRVVELMKEAEHMNIQIRTSKSFQMMENSRSKGGMGAAGFGNYGDNIDDY